MAEKYMFILVRYIVVTGENWNMLSLLILGKVHCYYGWKWYFVAIIKLGKT